VAESSKRQIMLAVLAVAVLAVAVFLAASQHRKPITPRMVWYYDIADGTLFPGEQDLVLPIDVRSGPNRGVLAHVYACGRCTPETQKVLYLESNTAEAKEILRTMPDPAGDIDASPYLKKALEGQLIAPAPPPGEEPAWIPAMHPDADAIRASVSSLCDPKDQAVRCFP